MLSDERSRVLQGIERGAPFHGPETIHVDVTNACHASCVTCWDHSPLLRVARAPEWKRRRMAPERLEALLDDASTLGGLRKIILSGMGEPFGHPDIERLIQAVKSRGLHLTVITHLTLADPARVVELGVDQLLVGVHAASEAAYRAFHPGFRGDEWRRLVAALGVFRAAGRRFKHVQVICSTNAHELPEMVRFADEHRAHGITFKLASLRDGTEARRITEDQRATLVADGVPRARALSAELGVATNLDVFARQLAAGGAETAPISEIGCFIGYTYARVTVDGTVLYCCDPAIVVGHLDEASFSELWSGPRWAELRARLRRGEYLPRCGQCGKLAQNVELRERFTQRYGEDRARAVTGAR
ncbi:MAG: radical SAM protein [Polyangiaceae bacterium]|nr:radical SAM protein [Polyangiaceae bacterium]